MKLKEVLSRIEKRGFFSSTELEEIRRRKLQLHMVLNGGIVIFDKITNAGFIFYIIESVDFYEVFGRRDEEEQELLLFYAKTIKEL